MKPVRQAERDDCVRACVASVLELQLEQVPRFSPVTWGEELAEWLEPRGWAIFNVRLTEDAPPTVPAGYSLAQIDAGPSFPSGWGHCVVCLYGAVVWDPNGMQPPYERPKEHTILYPLNPAGKL